MGFLESVPLPDDPTLAAWAAALNEGGYWAYVFDSSWQYVFITDDLRLSLGDTGAVTTLPLGCHFFSAKGTRFLRAAGLAATTLALEREAFLRGDLPRHMLATTPGGRDDLRRVVDPDFADLVDELQAEDPPPAWTWPAGFTFAGNEVGARTTWGALVDSGGTLAGYCNLVKPAAGMSHLVDAVASANMSHLARMRLIESPGRHPAAILMADLEASSALARRLSTAQFFSFVRRLVRAADHTIIDEGGIVGRHAGDGVIAYFLSETVGSESSAARSCIVAARALRGVLSNVAERSEILQSDLSLRFGLHWGATLYMGHINTEGRSEVTALGDEMNETARIEACATGARTLASKSLVERLNQADAGSLGLDHHHLSYTPLADLATATEKARRDAPLIAVCEV